MLFRLRLEPVDDLATGRLPDTWVTTDVAEYFIEVPDAPRLAHDPGMQMQHHQTPRRSAVTVQTIEPVSL